MLTYIGVAELTDQRKYGFDLRGRIVFAERFETGDLTFETIRNGAFNPSAFRFEQGFQRNGNLKNFQFLYFPFVLSKNGFDSLL